MSKDKVCSNCYNFHKGKDEDTDKLSAIIDDSIDCDKCKETHYKVTENTICINDKFKEK